MRYCLYLLCNTMMVRVCEFELEGCTFTESEGLKLNIWFKGNSECNHFVNDGLVVSVKQPIVKTCDGVIQMGLWRSSRTSYKLCHCVIKNYIHPRVTWARSGLQSVCPKAECYSSRPISLIGLTCQTEHSSLSADRQPCIYLLSVVDSFMKKVLLFRLTAIETWFTSELLIQCTYLVWFWRDHGRAINQSSTFVSLSWRMDVWATLTTAPTI